MVISEEQFRRAVADELAKKRKELSISQLKVLNATGIHIGRIECMGRPMNLFHYYRICHYLGIPFHAILEKVQEELNKAKR